VAGALRDVVAEVSGMALKRVAEDVMYEHCNARPLAQKLAAEIWQRRFDYSRILLRDFQRRVGIVPDGLYGGEAAGALRYFLQCDPPHPLFAPLMEKAYDPQAVSLADPDDVAAYEMARDKLERERKEAFESLDFGTEPSRHKLGLDLVMGTEIEDGFLSRGILRVLIRDRYHGDRLAALKCELRAQCLKLELPAYVLCTGMGHFSEMASGVEVFRTREVEAARFLSDLFAAHMQVDPACAKIDRGDHRKDRVARAQLHLGMNKDGVIGLHTARAFKAVLAVAK
jgi:hypothetical protein